jgi:hypothetical protein
MENALAPVLRLRHGQSHGIKTGGAKQLAPPSFIMPSRKVRGKIVNRYGGLSFLVLKQLGAPRAASSNRQILDHPFDEALRVSRDLIDYFTLSPIPRSHLRLS